MKFSKNRLRSKLLNKGLNFENMVVDQHMTFLNQGPIKSRNAHLIWYFLKKLRAQCTNQGRMQYAFRLIHDPHTHCHLLLHVRRF